MEGQYLLRWHAYRERKPGLRRRKIESVLRRGDPLCCEVCKFDFGEYYGERGRGYIECHHVEPLHVTGQREVTIRDLALLCSNCHRMIHTRPPWPTPAELGELIRRQGPRSVGLAIGEGVQRVMAGLCQGESSDLTRARWVSLAGTWTTMIRPG
jgi:5-methylcytosine-specific restriction protein A